MVTRTSRAYGLALCLFAAGALTAVGCSSANNDSGSGGSPGSGGSGSGGAIGSGGAVGSGGSGSGGAVGSGGSGSGGSGSGGAVVDAAQDMAGSGGAVGVDAKVDMGGGTGGAGGATAMGCDVPGLTWKTASKTNFTSYPTPGSEECIVYSGCMYQGQFAACSKTQTKAWVMSHNIVAIFPDRAKLNLHDLCLKSGNKTIVVTVYDECGDSDCDGCCTENKGSADELIDLETFTDNRWGVPDGRIQWADLGPTKGGGCN